MDCEFALNEGGWIIHDENLLARTIVAPQEMPIGVITAFIGAPTLIFLIRRRPYLYNMAAKRACAWTSPGGAS